MNQARRLSRLKGHGGEFDAPVKQNVIEQHPLEGFYQCDRQSIH